MFYVSLIHTGTCGHFQGRIQRLHRSELLTDFKFISFTCSYLVHSWTKEQSGTNHLYVSISI